MSYAKSRRTAVFDIECYRDYFLVMFRSVTDGRTASFEMYPGQSLDRDGIRKVLANWRVVSFNGNGYDIPILSLALSGASNIELKKASDNVILADLKPWHFYDQYDVRPPRSLDHIDLIEVAPGQAGLKIYGGRLHSKRMQDLPIEPDANILPVQRKPMREYCANDLQTTIDLYEELTSQLELRCVMSDEFNIDLRSKSDAQIAEAVIRHEVEKATGKKIVKPKLERPCQFNYVPPDYIEFRTENMQRVLRDICKIPIIIGPNGRVSKSSGFDKFVFTIGDTRYKMGIGGLHSQESRRSLYSDIEYVLIDRDVASYYPKLIINNNLIPPALGQVFIKIYKDIHARRLTAKAAGQKAISEILKIVLNGTFGKLGQPFSIFYAPRRMVNVTLSGQLSLLMAIERLEMNGIRVVSANTDGFVSMVPRDKIDLFNAIMFDWECDTNFETEEVRYKSLHSRDVNNYIAIPYKFDKTTQAWLDEMDKPKVKGVFAASGPGLPAAMGLKKNPQADISTDAVVEYLMHGTPIEDTILQCEDIRKFVSIRKVDGGAVVDAQVLGDSGPSGWSGADATGGIYLGKAVRWYYAEGVRGSIHYKRNGNRVPQSAGARPLMQLPDDFPDDIDYNWYAREAYGSLHDVGARYIDPALIGRSGEAYGRLPDRKTVHNIDLSSGVALCGAVTPGPRVPWVESDAVPDGYRVCAACRREGEL